MQTFLAILILAAGQTAVPAFADFIKTNTGTVHSRPVRELTQEGVVTDDTRTFPWSSITSVLFDRPPLQAPGHRIILRDGTSLCGMVQGITRDAVTFRSIATGELTVAWTNLTAIRYGTPSPFPAAVKIAKDELAIVKDTAERVQGQLVGATANNILIRTANGLQKVSTDTIAWLVASPTVLASRDMVLILRNGDRLNGPVTWTQKEFSATVNGRVLSMDQAAVRAIVCPAPATKNKE